MDKNMFGIGPKGIFWLRLYSNLSQAGVLGSMFTDLMTAPHSKWILGGVAFVGLLANAVASGNPTITAPK